jgi:hypothetical protein
MSTMADVRTATKPTATNAAAPEPIAAMVTSQALVVALADGRSISVPITWFPRLVHGTSAERANLHLTYAGVHWPDLNEDISVAGLLRGEGSGESKSSIGRWLRLREKGQIEPVLELPMPRETPQAGDRVKRRQTKSRGARGPGRATR